MTHRIELDSVRKSRRKSPSEYRYINRARCGDIVSQGDGDNIRNCLVKMATLGMTGEVEVWRGQTPVFAAKTIEKWLERKKQPEHLRRRSDR